MTRSPRVFASFATAITVSACATPMGAVRQAVASAPEWYQEARVEIRGEGYPDVSRVSGYPSDPSQPRRVETTRLAVADAETIFRLDEAAMAAGLSEAEALAWAADQQAAFEAGAGTADFLTEEDVEDLRGVFNVRRARP